MMNKAIAVLAFLALIAVPVLADTNTSMVLDYLPYAEPATYVKIKGAYLDNASTMITDATVNFELNATNFTMPFNTTSNAYETTVLFTAGDIGNWTFNIYANKTGYISQTQNGTIRIRQPIYVTLRLFQDNNQTVYSDNFAQVVLKSSYSCFPYMTATSVDPYSGETLYYTDCHYNTPYIDGFAQLKVYEKGSYDFYLISGVMTYANQFAYPTIERQTYKLSLGSFSVSESPTNVNIVMTSCELNPEQCERFAFSVFLWVLLIVIAGVVGLVAGKFGGAGVGLGVGFLVLIGLILLRLALLGY